MRGKINVKFNEGAMLLIYTTVLIMAFMIVMPTITIRSSAKTNIDTDGANEAQTESPKVVDKDITIDGIDTINVYLTSEARTIQVPIEEYVAGVVSNEMPVSFGDEALKAQAVAARTFVASRKIKKCPQANGADVCDSTHCQVYSSKEATLAKWNNNQDYWNKIQSAVDGTKGQVLSYDDQLVLYPQFFSTSSGNTENSVDANWGDVPYLKSVASPGEEIAPKFQTTKEMTLTDFINTVTTKYPDIAITTSNISSYISIVSRSDAGGVKEIKIGDTEIKGTDFRFLVGLNSTNFTYNIANGNITFNVKGYGHGVGMSQWGANVMSKNGKTYDEILKHYYTGVKIVQVK